MITARDSFKKGILTARPKKSVQTLDIKTGVQSLGLDFAKDCFIYIPKNYSQQNATALALLLHGAGGQAEHGLNLLKQYADDFNIILVAPAARAITWDIIAKETFNGDVIFIDEALSHVFDCYNIDAGHIAIGGFSDGASYALSLGLINGDLFTHIIAFSPGFYYSLENKGKPGVFISHGVKDMILPIAPCSRRLVPRLKRLNYKIHYEEFQGEHEIPAAISTSAVNWFLQ